jgi:hypothetical protein
LSLPCRELRNFCSAFVAYDASAMFVADVSAAPVFSTLREPRMPNKSVSERVDSAIDDQLWSLGADALALLLLLLLLLILRLCLLRLVLLLLILLLLRLGSAGALHVDAAAEVRAFSNGDAR